MSRDISLNNTSFDFLRDSSNFLQLIINNISSCILLLDKDMKLYAFNDALKTIFSNKENEHILYKKCGNVIGCAHAIEEVKECGNTSQCQFCELRESAIRTYVENIVIYKEKFSKEFYRTDLTKRMKHLQFSTRLFEFENDKYIIMIIDDVTLVENQQNTIQSTKEAFEKLLKNIHYQ